MPQPSEEPTIGGLPQFRYVQLVQSLLLMDDARLAEAMTELIGAHPAAYGFLVRDLDQARRRRAVLAGQALPLKVDDVVAQGGGVTMHGAAEHPGLWSSKITGISLGGVAPLGTPLKAAMARPDFFFQTAQTPVLRESGPVVSGPSGVTVMLDPTYELELLRKLTPDGQEQILGHLDRADPQRGYEIRLRLWAERATAKAPGDEAASDQELVQGITASGDYRVGVAVAKRQDDKLVLDVTVGQQTLHVAVGESGTVHVADDGHALFRLYRGVDQQLYICRDGRPAIRLTTLLDQ